MPDAPAFAVIVDTAPPGYTGRHRRLADKRDDPSARPETVTVRTYVGRHTADKTED